LIDEERFMVVVFVACLATAFAATVDEEEEEEKAGKAGDQEHRAEKPIQSQ